MSRLGRLLVCVWSCSVWTTTAQTLTTGQGGIGLSDDGHAVVLAPPPVHVGEELTMAELPLSMSPPQFFLNVGTSGRYGPYALADNTPVGNAKAPYTLRMFDYGKHFTLHPPHTTNVIYGPFPATNGTLITLGSEIMTLVRFAPELRVTLSHPDKINQVPLIGIAPFNNDLLKELYGLRAKYVGLANRVDVETSDVEFQGVPRVHYSNSRRSSSPVVSTSHRDKQNARKGAELSAVRFLETLFGKFFRIRPQAITSGNTYHFGMPPGDYVFCALQKVKDPHSQGVTGSASAVWWTTFHFDGEHPFDLSLSADNTITWREIFVLDKP